MYPERSGLLGLILGVNLIWLLGLSLLTWQNSRTLGKLFPDFSKGKDQGDSLSEKLDRVLRDLKVIEYLRDKSFENIQRVALKRYNPYNDTGGDQSFSVTLLDGRGDGVVISSLHSRSNTRVFAKPVKGGKEDQFEFSKEEQEVIKEALSQKP